MIHAPGGRLARGPPCSHGQCGEQKLRKFMAPQTKILEIETNDLVSLFAVLSNESLPK